MSEMQSARTRILHRTLGCASKLDEDSCLLKSLEKVHVFRSRTSQSRLNFSLLLVRCAEYVAPEFPRHRDRRSGPFLSHLELCPAISRLFSLSRCQSLPRCVPEVGRPARLAEVLAEARAEHG